MPTEKAARIALRTQQVIAYETGVANVADPLGGSWYVEALTDEMEQAAEKMFAHLDDLGGGSMTEGVYEAIDNGWFQGAIADAAYQFERKINSGERDRGRREPFTEGTTTTTSTSCRSHTSRNGSRSSGSRAFGPTVTATRSPPCSIGCGSTPPIPSAI